MVINSYHFWHLDAVWGRPPHYEEELRALATATLPPGGEGGGYGANDLASPIFPAWSKQERAGCILECTLAALTIITLREGSLPPVLKHLSLPVNSEHSQIDKLGQTAANMADQFRGRVYGWPDRPR